MRSPAFHALLIAAFLLVPTPGATDWQTLKPRIEAPDFVLRDLDMQVHELSALRGSVVIVNFWATWCPPCLAELPSLQRLWQQFAQQDFVLLAVSAGDEVNQLEAFARNFPVRLTFPVLIDTDLSISRFWPLRGLPTTFVVDKSGKVAVIVHGARQWDSAETVRLIEHLVNEPSS